MSPLNSNKLFFSQIFTTFQQAKTICPQLKFTNVQLFSFFLFNLYTVYFDPDTADNANQWKRTHNETWYLGTFMLNGLS